MHTHLTLLGPGKGYKAHADKYDVVIVMLEGVVDTMGERIEAPAVIFHDRGDLHGIKNVGDICARYVVFELEA
jgi:hypothetical protein